MAPQDKEPKLATVFADLMSSIDLPTFEQILEMDDDADREFSKTLVFEFLNQAEETFERLEEGLKKEDLASLSSQGHYLKGSSATLGLIKIRDSCEKIQRYGLKENVDGSPEPDEALCLKRIKETLKELQSDFKDTARALKKFYGEEEEEEEEDGEEAAPTEDTEGTEVTEDTTDTKDAKDAKDTKDTKDIKDTKDVTDTATTKDATKTAAKEPEVKAVAKDAPEEESEKVAASAP